MDSDERLRWLETRITSSLRPRADDLRNLFGRDESRGSLLEFFFNNDARRLFVYITNDEEAVGDALKVSLSPPVEIKAKCLCFLKTGSASQIHSGNLDDSITCMDWAEPLSHSDMLLREVYLPLLCTDTDMVAKRGQDSTPLTNDKLMDVLHRLLANIEVTRGLSQGKVCLPLPSIEVLAEAAAFQHRQPAVVHVLESTVISWIKQIRGVLRHDALASARTLSKEAKESIRPHHEVTMWEEHIEHMTSILEQLEAPIALDILMNLTHANSAYAKSFGTVRAEVESALTNARARLRCFTTVLPWIQDMYRTSSLERMLKVFPPLLHTVLLIWKHSDYYHNGSVFAHLLQMLSNEVVARARSLVGDNPFEDTQRSYVALKDALRLCAAFRGTYLDVKEAANEINTRKLETNVVSMARLRPKDHNVLFQAKMYGPTGFQQLPGDPQVDGTEDHWEDSAWPSRNVACFRGLSRFVERCNDLLDLVETTRHFCTLERAAKIGGAGSRSLDALVKNIHQVFVRTIEEFTKKNQDVLTIDDKQHFEKAFFHYRSVVKTLERRLAGVLRKSLTTCQTPMGHLRVLEVFEGISARELLQKELSTENDALVSDLIAEFKSVKSMFAEGTQDVPKHANMPPTVSKFYWIRALKQRIGIPMRKLRAICPHVLESDKGWLLRDTFTDVMNELERYESKLQVSWMHSVDHDVRDRLKNFVLAPEEAILEEVGEQPNKDIQDGNEISETTGELESPRERMTTLKVNLDQKLLVMMRDIKYIQRLPYEVSIPASVRALLRTVDADTLNTQATRLQTVVSKYNHIVKKMKEYELLLFENKMRRVDELVLEGRESITWMSSDLEDYLEKANAVISEDVYRCLTRVHNNWAKVEELARSWSEGELGIFTSNITRSQTHSLKELLELHEGMDLQYKNKLIPAGVTIHKLLQDSFEAIEISAASPAWQLYTAQMDAVVLISLKNSILTSLDAMYAITTATTDERLPAPPSEPILTVRLELVEQTVSFTPPMDRSASVDNIEDAIGNWLATYLKRANLVNRLTDPSSTYSDFINDDSDVWEVVEEIQNAVGENMAECKQLLSLFDNYRFLWVQDVQQSFYDFLSGRPSPNPLRASKQSQLMKTTSQITGGTSQRSRFSMHSPDAVTEAERAFLTPHHTAARSRAMSLGHGGHPTALTSSSEGGMEANIPGLAEFDEEIGIYKAARDNIQSLADFRVVGWLNINFQPIKQVLITYASKWMWTFTKYLCDQVTDSLNTLAGFLARTEPEIESITGEERDTASFMKMMRLFNDVSAQQQEMEEKFAIMHRTVFLLEKYGMKLSSGTQQMFKSAPDRWNHLKTKVSLAKQRLGPRIQEESARITRDLLRFGDRVEALASELHSSAVFSKECPIHSAIESIDVFSKRLRLLQKEAQDLIELQELLETAVVNFSILPQHQKDLKNLKVTWEHKRLCEAEQREWKLKHWQKIDVKQLQQATRRQKELIESLPNDVMDWDVYHGMIDSVIVIEQCLPLVENLNNPAMRTRHWKQLVRVTGGLLQTDTDSLRKMVLGDLLELGLQKHAEEVKSIVQRAVKDLTIETSLKTCEEVWLGKVFEVQPHTRGFSRAPSADIEAGSEITGSEMMPHAVLQTYEGSRTTGGTKTKSLKSGPHSRSSDKTGPGSISRGRGGGRTSVLSLPISLVNLIDDPSPICLLKNVDKIFAELEHHQIELTRMQSNSAIGAFMDEVTKWQKKLQLLEAVLRVWVSVQEKWVQLDEIYSGADVRTALAHEANMFAVMSKDFRLLMRATEKNINVLQSCSRKGLLPMLEKMDSKMEQCRHALLGNLERRRQRFPRFYFLSPEDVMNIVCYGYDLNAVNKYLCKVLPNLGKLIYDEKDGSLALDPNKLNPPAGLGSSVRRPKKYFLVKGVSSTTGEEMILSKSLSYEGPMSQWLPQLIEGIKVTLQEQLHVALGFAMKPATEERDLRSAGATKVRVSRPSSATSQRSKGSVEASALADGLKALGSIKERPSDLAIQVSKSLGVSVPLSEVSWTLDNNSQVALLATSIKHNTDLLEAARSGDKVLESLKALQDKTQASLDSTVIMLKGMEDERTSRLKSATYKSAKGKEKAGDGAGGKRDGTAYSESFGAPSSTRSLLEDDIDVGGDEASVNDAMEGTGPAPINTMQSLLFTEQMQSGGQGIRQEAMEMELADTLPREVAEIASTAVDSKLLRYPAQIHKIASLITVLAQQRDSCNSLLNKANSNLEQSFDFQAQLHYLYDEETMKVSLRLISWLFEYGHEYQGSSARYIVSPSCDRVILSMCQALHSQRGVLLSRSKDSVSGMSRMQTLSELAGQMGRALYSVVCSSSVDRYMLGDLFKGLAETGCWLCLESIGNLAAGILSVACQLAGDVLQALRTGQHTLTLQSEEVNLVPSGGFFATLDYSVKHLKNVKMFCPHPDIAAHLPVDFLKHFRVVSATRPDSRTVLEIRLLAHGFTQAVEISQKLCTLLDLAEDFFSCMPQDSSGINLANGKTNVVSLHVLEKVIGSAGVAMDALLHKQMEKKQEYREVVANKVRKFAELWRHKSSVSGSVAIDSGGETDVGLTSSSSATKQLQEVVPPPQRSDLEEDVEAMRKMEEEAIAIAIKNLVLPRMPQGGDRSILVTLIQDLWPDVGEDFGIDDAEEVQKAGKVEDSWLPDIGSEVSTPVLQTDFDSAQFQRKPSTERQAEGTEVTILSAMAAKNLCPSGAFQSRVSQLVELADSTKAIITTGNPGCGKTTAIEVYAEVQKQMGVDVTCKTVYLNAFSSSKPLFGYYERETREWRDGLIQQLLRPYCFEKSTKLENDSATTQQMLILHLDGVVHSADTDMFMQLLQDPAPFGSGQSNPGTIILPNNERLRRPAFLRIIWEMESLAHLTPSSAVEFGVLAFRNTEITWRVHLNHWVEQLPEMIQELLRDLFELYLPKIVGLFTEGTKPSHVTMSQGGKPPISLKQVVKVSIESMTLTFCRLLGCLTGSSFLSISEDECERYVGYAAFWAFGGTLDSESRDVFTAWWNEQWPVFFPKDCDPWHVFVDSDTRAFTSWANLIPQFTGLARGGQASSRTTGGSSQDEEQRQLQQDKTFVHTQETMQLNHIMGLLNEAGHPVMIAGPAGCGKTALVQERVNAVSSGEVAEVLSLSIHCNRLTEAGGLWKRISNYLEWKHGSTYVPRGNKKLLCVVDDLNLSKPISFMTDDKPTLLSACEIIRQHLDTGGIRNVNDFKWQQVSNVSYVTTVNPTPSCAAFPLNQRLSRHFAVFTWPYPSEAMQKSIFCTMLSSHFLHTSGTTHLSGAGAATLWHDRPMLHLLNNVTMVTIELQERLRKMYLPIPERAHYLFTLNDLDRIFRNLILSLRRDCGHKELLLLWRHECDWTYGRRMVSDVDLERYHQALDTATRKYLTGNKHLPLLISPKQPLFSSVRELDSGLVTAGRYEGRISQSALRNVKTETTQDVRDYYKGLSNDGEAQVHKLLSEAVKEYNKVNVGMNLSLYRDTVKLVCRLARILQSPHKTGHTLLFGEGCPMLARLSVNLAAHLGGFHVKTLRPSLASPEESIVNSDEARLAHFKDFMANLYNLTGVKGQKIVLFLSDDRVLTHECIAVAEELVRHGAISHMFSGEEQTTIANSVRSEVTAAGLSYSKDVAWNFFQSTVMKNLRIVFASSDMGKNFMATSHEFSALFNHLNIITMLPWSREQLVEVTLYHIQSGLQGKEQSILAEGSEKFAEYKRKNRRPMNGQWMENVAHLLANMHVSVRQKSENKFYKMPGHVSNYGFEKLVLRFVDVFHARRLKIQDTQNATANALSNLDKENAIVETLQKDLAREKQILEEHKIGTTQLLSQIGQDMVITQQQKSAVQQQIRRIHHLKKSLPEYQHAHERSVFKASAIVADTKKLVKDIDVQSLTELRALQKPDNDVEDLMACIIMILKSPNSDLTWSKGAKRQMANIDRFIDELVNFDNGPLPQTTLDALDPTLEKETFTAESLQAKAGGNLAVGTLVRWVKAVVRYHTLMISKVKPLHGKLEETSTAIAGAEHKLRQLESKMHALEARLLDLGDGFEHATADKNQQEKKQSEMKEHLKKAAEFQRVIADEHRRRSAVLDACDDQLKWVTGVAAVAAGFATYMGPYPYMFRRMLLTVDWARCFVERGIPLVFDSIDPVRGHRIEFMLDVQDGAADMTPRIEDGQTGREEQEEGEEEVERESEGSTNQQSTEQKDEDSTQQSSSEELAATDSNTATNLPPVAEETDADDEGNDTLSEASKKKAKSHESEKMQEDGIATFTESTTMAIPAYTYATMPFMSTEEYQMFVGSIVKVLVGEELMQEWLMKDFSHHQLQNAVILHTSWQRPPLLLDPYLAGVDWYASVFCQDKKIVPVNLSSKTDNAQVIVMEKAIMAGHTLMLMDCEQQPGNFLRPLVYHANMTRLSDKVFREGTRSLRWLGRRLICPDSFRLCMSTAQPAHNIHPNIIAASQLISYVPSTETLQEDLLNRALSRVRPEIFQERKRVMHALRQHRRTLAQLDEVLNTRLVTEVKPRQIENSTKFISSIVELKAQVFEELRVVENLFTTLNELSEELFPIARRAALLYTICRAMPALNPHYQIPLPFFLHLFDTTIGNDQEEDDDEFALGDVKVVKPLSDDVDDQAYKEGSDGPQISPSDLRQRRKSKLRLGSASRLLKRGIKDEKESDAGGSEADESAELSKDDGKNKAELVSEEQTVEKQTQFEITIPTTGHFPTENMEYTNFPAEEVAKIVSSVTERVFEHIYHSVNSEHQLHVAALTLLNIELDASMRQEEEKEAAGDAEVQNSESREKEKPAIFSEEELTLLIHGNPGFGGGVSLSLEDFDCQAPVPNWMSADHWEDLLAFSVLPGPLEGICVQVAQYADHWREWYECPEPELAPFPTKTDAGAGEKSEDVSDLSDFHRLLLVRTLRPDRLLPALRGYVRNHVPGTDLEKTFSSSEGPDCEILFKDVPNTLGVLVALPDMSDPNVHATLPMSPISAIKTLAERFKTNITVVSVGDGCQQDVTQAIEQAHAEDCWLVVDGLHFAGSKFYEDLQLHLARIGNISRQSGVLGEADKDDDAGAVEKPAAATKAPKFLVWLTTLPSLNLPPTLTQYLYKLSWESLIRVASQSSGPGGYVLPESAASVFKATLLCNLQSVPDEISTKVSEAPCKPLYYSACVCHAVALTGQCFGWHGLTRRYALTDAVLHSALSHIVSDAEAPHAIDLIKKLYSDVVTAEQDTKFMMKLIGDVLSYSMKHPDSKLRVNSTDIPVPPSSLSPTEYAIWASKEIPDDIDSTSLVAVHPSAHQWKITQTSEAMLEELQNLFDAAQDTAYETSVAVSSASDLTQSKIPISLASVQTSIEMCLEQLPNLLELGGHQLDMFSDFDFPYHRPSVLSINNSPSAYPLPESIGYVLMQECLWFNRLLCLIRQQLHRLRRSLLLMSDYKLSKTLVQTAQALIAEDVPSTWLHPNDLPSTHTLLTWLADMNMRYTQFRSWIKEGVVPLGSKSPMGKLTSVWLGGLVNPKALLTAICHEKAVTHDVSIEKVTLKSKILPEMENQMSTMEDHEPSICLKYVHSLNMKWNPDDGFLGPLSSKDKEINEVPVIYLYPVIEEEEEASSSGKEPLLHDFPVYMNISRQILLFYLPLPVETISSSSTELQPGMQHASIVLQAGLDAARRNLCKTRAHLARKRREEWEKVTPEISELMSRSATRLSSGQISISGPQLSYGKGGERGSISSHRTSQLLSVPPGHKKKRGSLGSTQGLDAGSKAKSSSQHSLSSHASTMLSHKPPSRVAEEREEEEDRSDAQNEAQDEGNDKPLPNGRIIHKHPTEVSHEGDQRPPDGAAGTPGTNDAVARGVIAQDFFAIKEAPSTEASLLQSILDEDQPEDDETDDNDGGSDHSQPPSVSASDVGGQE